MDIIDELLGEVASLGVLPSVRFFRPRPTFYATMRAFRGLTIYDVGAGVGHISAGLKAEGHDVVAIDVTLRDDTEHEITIGNGATFDYESGSVVMICRPCHGPLVEHVVAQAVRKGAAHVLYVGKSCNVAADLGRFRKSFRRFGSTDVGAEREWLYVWNIRGEQ